MSRLDILDARRILLIRGVQAALVLAAKPLLTTTMASIVIVGVLSVLELGLRHYQGDLARKEFVVGVIGITAAPFWGAFGSSAPTTDLEGPCRIYPDGRWIGSMAAGRGPSPEPALHGPDSPSPRDFAFALMPAS